MVVTLCHHLIELLLLVLYGISMRNPDTFELDCFCIWYVLLHDIIGIVLTWFQLTLALYHLEIQSKTVFVKEYDILELYICQVPNERLSTEK